MQWFLDQVGAGRRSVVEHSLMVQVVDESISFGGPIELFLFPASAPWCGKSSKCTILSVEGCI